jgi:dCTP deaminase
MSDRAIEAPEPGGAPEAANLPTGILPAQTLRDFLRDKTIQSLTELDGDQIQPASLDLRLGRKAYRIRASFLPGREATVAEKLASFSMRQIDLMNDVLCGQSVGLCYKAA